MRNQEEYVLAKQIAAYLRLQYPKIYFHFDMAGFNLSKAQAGMNKAIQHSRGFPDLFIAEAKKNYHGLFIELKKDGTRLYKENGTFVSLHIQEQSETLKTLRFRGYQSFFGTGFDHCKNIIDNYLLG